MASLADAWRINSRVTLRLLELLTDEQLAYSANPARGQRTIADQLGHLHAVRVMWLERIDRTRAKGMPQIEKGAAVKDGLRDALERSGEAIAEVLAAAQEAGSMKGFQRGPEAFLAYLIAHEGHHRGQMILHLKYGKMPIDRMAGFGLWEWGRI